MADITKHTVLAVLGAHVGRTRGLKTSALVTAITGSTSPARERVLRNVIVELREQGWHICGHPGEGYYMAASEQELEDTCLFLYERAMTSLTQISAMKRIALPDIAGQLKLPT